MILSEWQWDLRAWRDVWHFLVMANHSRWSSGVLAVLNAAGLAYVYFTRGQGLAAARPVGTEETRPTGRGRMESEDQLREEGPGMRRIADWWFLSALRRALLRDPVKIDEYNAAVDRYNAST